MSSKKIFFGTLTLALLLSTAVFAQAWSVPTAPPPGDNAVQPINIGSASQTKFGGLIINSGGATDGLLVPFGKVGIGTLTPNGLFEVKNGVNSLFTILANGNVGVGVAVPASRLSVSGGIKIGDDSSACTAGNDGTLRWRTGKIQVCKLLVWTDVGSSTPSGPYTYSHTSGFCSVKQVTTPPSSVLYYPVEVITPAYGVNPQITPDGVCACTTGTKTLINYFQSPASLGQPGSYPSGWIWEYQCM